MYEPPVLILFLEELVKSFPSGIQLIIYRTKVFERYIRQS